MSDSLGHQWPLLSVSVTAATEHSNEPAGRKSAHRGEELFDSVGRVGIVDNDGRRVGVIVCHDFHASWNLRTSTHAFSNGFGFEAEAETDPASDQEILEVEVADERYVEIDFARRQFDANAASGQGDVCTHKAYIGRCGRIPRNRDHSGSACFGGVDKLACTRIVEVHDRATRSIEILGKEQEL